jgi:hypothetical protein
MEFILKKGFLECCDEIAYNEILKCTYKDLIIDSDRYSDRVECDVFNP